MHQIEFSICICTYNRADKLQRLLAHMVKHRVLPKNLKTELLLIDNNSTDNTKQIIQSFANKLPIKYLFEQKQGLSNARNCALKNAEGNWLVFTDDDVLPSSSWLSEYRQALSTFPEVDYLGGKVKSYWQAGKPKWLKDERLALLSGVLVHYDLGENNFLYQHHHPSPYGASFAISQHLIKSIGNFNTELGVKGNNIGRGEESEYFQRAVDAGYQGVYVGTSMCMHDVDLARLSSSYMFKHGVQKGLAQAITKPVVGVSFLSEVMFVLKSILQLVKGRRDRYYQCIINLGLLRGLRQAQADKK